LVKYDLEYKSGVIHQIYEDTDNKLSFEVVREHLYKRLHITNASIKDNGLIILNKLMCKREEEILSLTITFGKRTKTYTNFLLLQYDDKGDRELLTLVFDIY